MFHEFQVYYWPLFFISLLVGEAIDSNPDWYLGRKFLMCAVCILLLLPLCLPKTLKVLSYSRSVDFIKLLLLVLNAVKCSLMELITRSTSLALVVSGVHICASARIPNVPGPELCFSSFTLSRHFLRCWCFLRGGGFSQTPFPLCFLSSYFH